MRGFISYARQNEKRVQRLKDYLAPLEKRGEVQFVDDHSILPGERWDRAIAEALAGAQLILLCVSQDFLDSEIIYKRELAVALARHDAGTALVIPVILTYCDWQDLKVSGRRLGNLQAVPRDGRPIEAWVPASRGYADAARRIRKVVEAGDFLVSGEVHAREAAARRPPAKKAAVRRLAPKKAAAKKAAAKNTITTKTRDVVVPVFYGTTRGRSGHAAPHRFYGRKRMSGADPELGLCRVSVPTDKRMGELTSPKWWKGELRPIRGRHVVLLGLTVLEAAPFFRRLRERVGSSEETEALVFVHGFKTSFSDAVRRTGQLAYDLGFNGAPIAFSWPTTGGLAGYSADEAAVNWSAPFLETFLEEIAKKSQAKKVHLIAHSMGSRALTEALERIGLKRGLAARPLFRQVVLAAPDVDVGTFQNLAEMMRSTARRVTLYASSKDRAISVSERIHQAPRAGSSKPKPLVVPQIDTVDVSAVDTGLLGHSYYGSNRSVVADLFNLIRNELPPSRRPGVREANLAGFQYWVFS